MLEKWLVRFMHGVIERECLGYEAYRVHARTLGFTYQVEKLEEYIFTTKTP